MQDDFFTSMPVQRAEPTPFASEAFVNAIGGRAPPQLTARLNHPQRPPPIPMSISSSPPLPSPPSQFQAVFPNALEKLLSSPNILLIDIRPHAAHAQARLPGSLSMSIPSTLLKRPAFSLQKLSTMLPTSARRRFAIWPSMTKIIVYDSDSTSLPEGSNILGLLRKFLNEGYTGEVAWIRGGFAAVWRDALHLVSDLALDSSDDDDQPGLLQAKHLPMAAFRQSSTTAAARRPSPPSGPTAAVAAPPASNRQIPANPFYDNIRQNVELSLGITERIPLQLPRHIFARLDDLPFQWLRDIVGRAEADEAEVLAMQFYKIELGEQRRLQGVMDHHSKHPGLNEVPFPYSITAGIERGVKNRYRDIWPFEHARVRLAACCAEDGSDYVNASYVQPLGTRRRYIATQGPLPSTYTDFWTLIWEQNVSVIVMLTRQVEGATVKCGQYWADEVYGPLRLKLIASDGPSDEAERSVQPCAFDFAAQAPSASTSFSPATTIVRRTFVLTHEGHPHQPGHKITQLQYLGWPDLNVPDDPKGLLWLIGEVDRAMEETRPTDCVAASQWVPPPVLLHCSAGVGRTGGFIVVDAVLDGVRREMQKNRQCVRTEGDKMEVEPSLKSQQDGKNHSPTSSISSGLDKLDDPSARDLCPMPTVHSSELHLDSASASSGPSAPPRSRKISTELVRKARLNLGRTSSEQTSTSGSSHRNRSKLTSTLSDSSSLSLPQLSVFDMLTSESETGSSSVSMDGGSGSRGSSLHKKSSNGGSPGNSESDEGLRAAMGAAGVHTSREVVDGLSGAACTLSTSFHNAPSEEPFFSMGQPDTPLKLPTAIVEHMGSSANRCAEMHSAATFDYTYPRTLHDDSSPLPLSSLEEPIRQVLEDMRMQRMSLCQSLRQYVFVHRAIVEGVLALVDDERRGNAVLSGGPSEAMVVDVDLLAAPKNSDLTKRTSLKRKQRGEESPPLDKNPAVKASYR